MSILTKRVIFALLAGAFFLCLRDALDTARVSSII